MFAREGDKEGTTRGSAPRDNSKDDGYNMRNIF